MLLTKNIILVIQYIKAVISSRIVNKLYIEYYTYKRISRIPNQKLLLFVIKNLDILLRFSM